MILEGIEVSFAIEKIGHDYRVIATDKKGRKLAIVEGSEAGDMAAAKLKWAAIRECPLCQRQALGHGGPNHFGSPRCSCGSLASGGYKAHCCCEICF